MVTMGEYGFIGYNQYNPLNPYSQVKHRKNANKMLKTHEKCKKMDWHENCFIKCRNNKTFMFFWRTL